jgi:hypothetical protein
VNSPILIGGLVLNDDVGGLNAAVVEAQARAGVKVVWLLGSRTCKDQRQR